MAVARRSRHRRLARSAVSSRQVKTLEQGEEPKAPRFRSGARSSSPPLKRKGDVTRFSYFSKHGDAGRTAAGLRDGRGSQARWLLNGAYRALVSRTRSSLHFAVLRSSGSMDIELTSALPRHLSERLIARPHSRCASAARNARVNIDHPDDTK